MYLCKTTVDPHPFVSLTSDRPSPVLSGSSINLTCSVELSPEVPIPVTVSTVWSGPVLTNAPNYAKQESLTLYRSTFTLINVESVHSGQYTCNVTIGSGIEASASTSIEIGELTIEYRRILKHRPLKLEFMFLHSE